MMWQPQMRWEAVEQSRQAKYHGRMSNPVSIEQRIPSPVEVSEILPSVLTWMLKWTKSLRANQVRCSAEVYAVLKEFLVVRRAVAKDLDEFVDRSIGMR